MAGCSINVEGVKRERVRHDRCDGAGSLGGTLVVDASGIDGCRRRPVDHRADRARRASYLASTAFRPLAATTPTRCLTYLPGAAVMNIFAEGDMDRLNGVDDERHRVLRPVPCGTRLWYEDVYTRRHPALVCLLQQRRCVRFQRYPCFRALILEQHKISNAMAAIERARAGVPEPASVILHLLGMCGLIIIRGRRYAAIHR